MSLIFFNRSSNKLSSLSPSVDQIGNTNTLEVSQKPLQSWNCGKSSELLLMVKITVFTVLIVKLVLHIFLPQIKVDTVFQMLRMWTLTWEMIFGMILMMRNWYLPVILSVEN